ncbi:hypothetical protein [Citrobacter sp. JGM124]|uniref:hypothetical protein n=1 Tax=Citrobacter sp. JGM124 TaxID=2799789 RepID=UPI001BA6CAE8|nr:hypothetical protein [Citrobacter sp. JGM124]MBS0849673.1 hypothetical protein [Citrobacter sp. JGM124]
MKTTYFKINNFKKSLIIFIPLIAVILTGCDSPEKRKFMLSCKLATRNGSICSCTWEKMNAIYPSKLLKAIGEEKAIAPRGFEQNMTNSMKQCVREE